MSETAEIFSDPSLQKAPSGFRLASLVAFGAVLSLSPIAGLMPPNWSIGLVVAGVSLLAAANATTEFATLWWLNAEMTVQRQTGRHASPSPTEPTLVVAM